MYFNMILYKAARRPPEPSVGYISAQRDQNKQQAVPDHEQKCSKCVRCERERGRKGGGRGWLYDWRELSDAMRGSFGGRGSLAVKTPRDELG